MTRNMFMTDLRKLLVFMSDEDRERTIRLYEEMLDEAGPENEQNLLAQFGSPTKAAVRLFHEYSSGKTEEGGLDLLAKGGRSAEAEPKAEPEPEPAPEPESAPEPEKTDEGAAPQAEPEAGGEAASGQEPETDAPAEPEAEAEAESGTEPGSEPESEPAPEAEAESEPEA